jgi:hypothetical protein
MLEEAAIRFVLGGLLVSLFAAIGTVLQPASFAGMFGSAPVGRDRDARVREQRAGLRRDRVALHDRRERRLGRIQHLVPMGPATTEESCVGRCRRLLAHLICRHVRPRIPGLRSFMTPSVDLKALRQTSLSETPVRFAFGGAMTAATGFIAQQLGPVVGGVFLAFPAVVPARLTLVAGHSGRARTVDEAGGAILGAAGAGGIRCRRMGAPRREPRLDYDRRRRNRVDRDCIRIMGCRVAVTPSWAPIVRPARKGATCPASRWPRGAAAPYGMLDGRSSWVRIKNGDYTQAAPGTSYSAAHATSVARAGYDADESPERSAQRRLRSDIGWRCALRAVVQPYAHPFERAPCVDHRITGVLGRVFVSPSRMSRTAEGPQATIIGHLGPPCAESVPNRSTLNLCRHQLRANTRSTRSPKSNFHDATRE